jgi:hypothetical protein
MSASSEGSTASRMMPAFSQKGSVPSFSLRSDKAGNRAAGNELDINLALRMEWKENAKVGRNDEVQRASFPALADGANFLFQKLFGGPNSFELLETPFKQHGPKIG